MTPSLDRRSLRAAVCAALEPLAHVHALWEGGSAAFGRDDLWSDVDLQACVDDDRVGDTFAAVEERLRAVAAISETYAMPEPTWHGHAQRFYRFAGAPPWLMLDLCVQKRSSENRFLEPEVHGEQPFLFDKAGIARATPPLDPDAWERKLRGRIQALRARVSMFAILAEKECRRRRPLDAIAFHQSLIIAPLVELLRIRHDPWRHHFGMRYLHEALPAPVARRLQLLVYVRNPSDLPAKQRAALSWFEALVRELSKKPRLMPPAGAPGASQAPE